jgi:hypothetical protein
MALSEKNQAHGRPGNLHRPGHLWRDDVPTRRCHGLLALIIVTFGLIFLLLRMKNIAAMLLPTGE